MKFYSEKLDKLFEDEKSLHATVFCLAQIGESVSKVSDEVKR